MNIFAKALMLNGVLGGAVGGVSKLGGKSMDIRDVEKRMAGFTQEDEGKYVVMSELNFDTSHHGNEEANSGVSVSFEELKHVLGVTEPSSS
ncbi:hypothetical protein [Mycoplasma suis]|uniref:Uncharacterized protein n=1 Tax=Mycoplasma suis (strain Illinois) TaxID=768700 RepID=F0QRW0_MYCSL|nr:hypothetical protein [Mycoplasma suis]ADX98230.1 hypothetical protein MSU_0699 [Mycoplasma suis str. Illinois]